MTGGSSSRATLPAFLVFWHSAEIRKALLSGLLNGDGSVSKNGCIEFYTSSPVLQQQAIFLLRSFGLTPTLNTSRTPPMIRLAGKHSREFAESIFLGQKRATLESYSRVREDDGFRQLTKGSRIPALKEVNDNGTEVVYSLEVEDTQNFFTTSGWLVHNCIPLSSKYVLEGAEKPEYLTILKETISTDSSLPSVIADRIADSGIENVGILGLSYKGDLKVHVLSPALRIARRLMERGVKVKINDPYYTQEEIKKIAGIEVFEFPNGLTEFECILIVASHRIYRAIPESQLLKFLTKCKLIIDNLEEAWKNFDWASTEIEYHIAGDRNWLK
jgi:hypothetical protein